MTNLNKKNVLISFITAIGCIISILAISIFTIFQAKAENNFANPTIQGLSNNAGVLKNLYISKSGYINDDTNSFYMENNNIIIKNPYVMIPGYNNSGNIILGGAQNKTESINTPIIGGIENTTLGDNTTFGGEGNRNMGGTLIGGSQNTIEGEGEGVIIGGTKNTIKTGATNTIILGGENIDIKGNNIIAAGEEIVVNNKSDNSFIFNNDPTIPLTPQTGNAFYINSQGGLGLNGEGSENAIVIHGGVSIGEIDFTNGCTNQEDIGIIGIANNCLLACTKISLNKWSLLENSERCINWCRTNNDKCIEPPTIPEIEYEPFPAYCTGSIFTGSTPCFTGFNTEVYENVVFTNNYVNVCPNSQENLDNPCTYKCPAGYSFGDGTCKKNCIITGDNDERIIVPHGESINLFFEKNPQCPHHCESKTRTCNDGNLNQSNANFRYLSCQIQINTGNQCNDNEYNIEENEKIEGGKYKACTGYTINGNSCTRHVKYKLDTCNSGYTLSGGICHKDCIFNGKTVHYGQTTTGYKYQNSNCKDEYLCNISKILKCGIGGVFETDPQEYQYTGCKLIGETCSGYTLNGCPNHGICSSCTGYTLNGNSCNQFIKYKLDSCSTGYSKNDNTCKADCSLPRGGTISHGLPAIGYKNNTQYCPNGCENSSNKKTMICNDGILDGSNIYIYSGCTTTVLSGQGFNRSTKIDHAICEVQTGYFIQNNLCVAGATKYKCTACLSGYTRNGQDWDGNNVKCLKDCSFTTLPNHETIYLSGNGGTIRTYNTGLFICPTIANNNSQIRTCNNGILDGSFEYTRYTQTGASCVIQNTSEIKTFTNKINNEGGNNLKMIKSCWGSAFNGNSCSEETTYYTYKCNTGYIRANNNSKCIKCEGNIPNNAQINNSTPIGNDSINYSYNTNTSVACTFSCKPGFTRNTNTNQCVSDSSKCSLDGIEYIEGTFKTIYENNKPICYNTCNQTKVQCKNGSRRDYENYRTVTGNIYSTCSTAPGYILNNGDLKEGICEEYIYSNDPKQKVFSGQTVPNSISNAYPTSTCIEYKNNGSSCKTEYKYRRFYCQNGWSGDTCPSSCIHNNIRYENGTQLTMYNKKGLFVCPVTIESQTRICNNNQRETTGGIISSFSPEFKYSINDYNLIGNDCPGFTGQNNYQVPPSGTNYESCTVYSTEDKICHNRITLYKITECGSGETKINNQCKKDCTLSGANGIIRVPYGSSIPGYKSNNVRCPNSPYSCSSKIITCGENGQFDDTSYKYNYCVANGPSCSNIEYPYDNTGDITDGSNIETCTGYTTNGHSCTTYTRYKISNCLPGYSRIESENECKKDCYFNGQKIIYGKQTTAFIPTTCPGPCQTQQIRCGENGQFIGTGLDTCKLKSSDSCSSDFNLSYCPNNGVCQTCTGYTYTNVCSANEHFKLIGCKTGYTKVGNICYRNCMGTIFGDIMHGNSITAYKFENGQCKSTIRTCYDGTLDNSDYNLASCSTCTTPRGTNVASGDYATGYKETKCTSSNTQCASVTRRCKNGQRYNGDQQGKFPQEYKYQNCKIMDGESNGCTNEYNTKASEKILGGIYEGGCRRYQYNGSSCEGQEYFKLIGCEGGYTGYNEGTCYKGCTARNKNYEHGQIVTGYKESSVMCTKDCIYETRRCINGKRYDGDTIKDFSGLYPSCTKTDNNCSGYPLTSEPENSNNCSYISCTTYKGGNTCTENGKRYALQSANDGYYATGSICSPICGNGYSTPCNGSSYTAIGATRGNGYTLRGKGYLCIKNTNSSVLGIGTRQCECPKNSVWGGSNCISLGQSMCDNDTVNSCVKSILIESEGILGGHIRTCGIEGKEEECHLCDEDLVWNANEHKCRRTSPSSKPCNGTEPTIEHIIKGSSTYLASLNTGRKYVEDTPLNECEWTCDLGYNALWDRNGNVTDCVATPAPDPHGCTPSYQWVCRSDNTIHCRSSCAGGYCGETNDSYCISRLGDKPSDDLCIENNGQAHYRKCTNDGNTQTSGYCRQRRINGDPCRPSCETFHSESTCENSSIDAGCCVWEYL